MDILTNHYTLLKHLLKMTFAHKFTITDEYITRNACKIPDTIFSRENRLLLLTSEKCGSLGSVDKIKIGFVARVKKDIKQRTTSQSKQYEKLWILVPDVKVKGLQRDLQNEEASSSCTPADICMEKLGHIQGHIRGRSGSTKHIFEIESLRMDLNSENEKSKQLEKYHLELKENHLKLQKDHVSLTKKVNYLMKHFTAWQSPESEVAFDL
ncbi:hypothetical protein Tco_0923931 [Tanacetum coccineum]|uniref:Uncharacterized protein n=1 Tax=Tanacetum coccineum TaxID=301880 RepID=A0ABQ5D556_9ASTR